jgi:ketosteroid isomerase-like protein
VSTQPDPPSRSAVEDEICALSEEKFRWQTEGRFDLLADLYDDDLVFVHLDGSITTKQEWLSELTSGSFVYDRIDLKEASARGYGDAAVLVGKATFTVNGDTVYKLVYTEVYARKDDRWKLVNSHNCSGTF